jgi:hypothetical protein
VSSVKQFKLWFADWEWLLIQEGELPEGIEEIKQAIRDDWENKEYRQLWMDYVKERSDFRKELIAMANGINERVKTCGK